MTQVARALGAGRVAVSDVDAHRRGLTVQLGASVALDQVADEPAAAHPVAAGDVADVLVDRSGVPAAVAAGLPAVRPGGSVVLVGMGSDEKTLPVSLLQNREIRLTGTFRYANTGPPRRSRWSPRAGPTSPPARLARGAPVPTGLARGAPVPGHRWHGRPHERVETPS